MESANAQVDHALSSGSGTGSRSSDCPRDLLGAFLMLGAILSNAGNRPHGEDFDLVLQLATAISVHVLRGVGLSPVHDLFSLY